MHSLKTSGILRCTLALAALLFAGCDGTDGEPGPAGTNATRTSISLTFLARARNPDASFDASAARTLAFDPGTSRLFVVNGESGDIDVFDLSTPDEPTFTATNSLAVASDIAGARTDVDAATDLGAARSVAVDAERNLVAVAIAAATPQDVGFVAFYETSGTFLSAVEVGAMPDMVTFTPDGSRVLVANEGEPSADYSSDPEGSISVINLSGGAAGVTDTNVGTAAFTAYNPDASNARTIPEGVRVFGPDATPAEDFEPEYIAVNSAGTTAYVALQENNAIAVVDIASTAVTDLFALGVKDHRLPGNEFDGADMDDTVNLRNWPVYGMYLPNAIASYEVAGITYLVTANEGDARAYSGFTEAARLAELVSAGATITLPQADLGAFLFDADNDGDVDGNDLHTNASLGRYLISTTTASGCDIADATDRGNCTFTRLHGFGARSFAIFNASTQQLVFDSGSDFERITAQRLGSDFNSGNDANDSGDSRSSARGPEPNAVALGVVDGRTYAFIGLEQVGGIMVYDVSVPEQSQFVQYINPRDFSASAVENPQNNVDLGPESIEFVAAASNPGSTPLLLVSNAVSGTINVFQVNLLNAGGG